MTFDQELALVVGLAMEIEDRTKEEQRALLAVAHHVDKQLNRQTIPNVKKYGDCYYLEPSRSARVAGCDKSDCRVCTKIPDRSTR